MRCGAGPRSWLERPRPGELILRSVAGRLLRAPALSEDQVRQRGADPADPGLIRLDRPDGGQQWPEFQFAPGRGPWPVVREVNQLLEAAAYPLGAADWWLSRNGWLDGQPSQLIGTIPDDHLVRARARDPVGGMTCRPPPLRHATTEPRTGTGSAGAAACGAYTAAGTPRGPSRPCLPTRCSAGHASTRRRPTVIRSTTRRWTRRRHWPRPCSAICTPTSGAARAAGPARRGRQMSGLTLTRDLDLVSLIDGKDLAAIGQDAWLVTASGPEYAQTRAGDTGCAPRRLGPRLRLGFAA